MHIVIGVLLAIALLVAAVVMGGTELGLGWFRSGSKPSDGGSTAAIDTEPIAITGIRSFDPSPGDGHERDDLIGELTDGDESTAWMTERYRARNLANKAGVGIIIELERDASTYRLTIQSTGKDWAAQAYRSSGLHDDLAGWGNARTEARSPTGPMTLEVGGAGGYVLLWITDPGVSEPSFRLAITEISVRG